MISTILGINGIVVFLFFISVFVIIFSITKSLYILNFHNSVFEIYENKKIIDRGRIKDIKYVNKDSKNHKGGDWFILIKTKEQKYVFGEGLTKGECIWLVQEIKSWLEQKQY